MRNFRVPNWPQWVRDGIPLICWLALIFTLSSRPMLVSFEKPFTQVLFAKSAHIFVYAILTWLCWRLLSPQRKASWPLLWAAFSLAVLYGSSDEIHQSYVPGRHGRFADILFDTSGALLMLWLLRRFEQVRQFPEKVVSWQ